MTQQRTGKVSARLRRPCPEAESPRGPRSSGDDGRRGADPAFTVRGILGGDAGGFGGALEAAIGPSEGERIRLARAWARTFLPEGRPSSSHRA
jgi:hypothetical protein